MVDSDFSCKVPRLKERREAEQNSDGDDDGVNNGWNKQRSRSCFTEEGPHFPECITVKTKAKGFFSKPVTDRDYF